MSPDIDFTGVLHLSVHWIVEIIIALIGAYVFWRVIPLLLPPILSFHAHILKTAVDKPADGLPTKGDPLPEGDRYTYQVKFANQGRRTIVDMTVIARLTLHLNGRLRIVDLALDTGRIPYMEPTRSRLGQRARGGSAKIISIHPELTGDFQLVFFPPAVREKSRSKSIDLQEIMQQFNGTLELIIIGTDSYSVVRKVFVSTEYTLADVKVCNQSDKERSFGELRPCRVVI